MTMTMTIYMWVFCWGGAGVKQAQMLQIEGNFPPFLDFCPNIVTLARKKIAPPPISDVPNRKKTRVRAWCDGGESLSRPEVGRFPCFLPIFLQGARSRYGKTPNSRNSTTESVRAFGGSYLELT